MDEQPGRLKPGPASVRAPAHPPTIFLSVGDPSGDLHGAALARALRERLPGVRLLGLGGRRMAGEGVELLADLRDLAVMGFAEVFARLPYFLRLRRRVFRALEAENVDLVIPVDYPGFNLRLARRARSRGIPVLYYIAPQVWAWHASRARDLARDADRVAVILPFEESFLRESGTEAEFVGHPLLDLAEEPLDRADWAERYGLDPDRPLLALLPGSRSQEVQRHLPVLTRAAELVRSRIPGLQVAVGVAESLDPSVYAKSPHVLVEGSRDLLRHATAAIVKSGTSTLDAALAGTPFVVVYRMHPLSYAIAQRLVRVPHIALANLVVERRLVPELVQDEANPEAIAARVRPLLDEADPGRAAMLAGLREVRERLSRGGAAARVAAMAAELLERV